MGLGGVPSGCRWRVGWWQAGMSVLNRQDFTTLKKQPGWEQVQRAGLCPGPFLPCATQHLTGEGRSKRAFASSIPTSGGTENVIGVSTPRPLEIPA